MPVTMLKMIHGFAAFDRVRVMTSAGYFFIFHLGF